MLAGKAWKPRLETRLLKCKLSEHALLLAALCLTLLDTVLNWDWYNMGLGLL